MTHEVRESMEERLGRRNSRVCEWLDRNRHRRNSLTPEDADQVAYRVGALLDRAQIEYGMKRGEIAERAFGLDFHAAHEKLRHYAYPRRSRAGLRVRSFSRTPNHYCRILEEVSSVTRRPFEELALEVFGTVEVVRQAIDTYGSELAARRFVRLLDQLAERLAYTYRLTDYYRAVMTNGVVRDLVHDVPRFDPKLGGDLVSPWCDCVEAALPVTDALDDDSNDLLELPAPFQGRLPAVPLYRLRVTRPAEVVLNLLDSDGASNLPQHLRGWVVYHWELRLCVGPRNNGASSAMFFEAAPLCLIHLRDPRLPSSPQHDGASWILCPKQMYEIPGRGWPESTLILCHGKHILSGEVIDATTGERFDDSRINVGDLLDVPLPISLDAVGYTVAGPTNSWHFLVQLPESYEERIERLYPSRGEKTPPMGGYFPTSTLGEWLERQLRQEGSVLEQELGETCEALGDAMKTLREERWAAAALDQTKVTEPALGESELTEYLAMDARSWREKLGLSQKEAAAVLGIVPRSLRNYEHDDRDLPHALRLAMLFCWLHPDLAQRLTQSARGR